MFFFVFVCFFCVVFVCVCCFVLFFRCSWLVLGSGGRFCWGLDCVFWLCGELLFWSFLLVSWDVMCWFSCFLVAFVVHLCWCGFFF